MNTTASAELYERARRFVPGGVHSNTRFRAPHPLYFRSAQGPYLYDMDGNRYTDLIMGNGAMLFGYRDEEFDARMQQHLNSGIVTGLETELSVLAAEAFLRVVRTAEQVRYANTGTEAVMHALMMARTATGKPDVAVIEGAYNGWYDPVYVSTWPDLERAGPPEQPIALPGSPGLPPQAIADTVVLPFNNLQAAEHLLAEHHHHVAALILEPIMVDVGYIPATQAYLQGLRQLCSRYGIVLIFDELLTGFRIAPGGAQEHYKVIPDLSIFGKALANGYMLAAVAGKAEVFTTVTPGVGPCAYVGTYNGHQVSLAASLAFFELYEERQAWQTLAQRTRRVKAEINAIAAKLGVPLTMCGAGGHLQWYFLDHAPIDYREAAGASSTMYRAVHEHLTRMGYYCSANYLGHHALSYAHDDEVLDAFVNHFADALTLVAEEVMPVQGQLP